MNWVVLKDAKTVLGLAGSFLLSIFAVFLATKDHSFWSALVVLSLIISFYSVRRADNIYKQKDNL